jgi:hypothetical protein
MLKCLGYYNFFSRLPFILIKYFMIGLNSHKK